MDYHINCKHSKRLFSLWNHNILTAVELSLISLFKSSFLGSAGCCWLSAQFSSVTQSCPTLCDPMNCSTPGLPVHHQLPESTQTHVRWVGDAIQPSHSVFPFSSCPQFFPASGSFPVNRLFASDVLSIGASASASIPPMNIQGWFPLGFSGLISLLSKGLSRVYFSMV